MPEENKNVKDMCTKGIASGQIFNRRMQSGQSERARCAQLMSNAVVVQCAWLLVVFMSVYEKLKQKASKHSIPLFVAKIRTAAAAFFMCKRSAERQGSEQAKESRVAVNLAKKREKIQEKVVHYL